MNNELIGFRPIDTPLYESPILSKEIGAHVLIKDESHQRTQTIKGRIIQPVMEQALHHRVDRLVVFWLGNTARALAYAGELYGVKVSCITQPHFPTRIADELAGKISLIDGVDVGREFLTEEKMEAIARQGSEKTKAILNQFPDYYTSIAREIAAKAMPDYIIIPLGSGSLFFGLWMGLTACGLTKTKIVGVTLHGKNPFSRACTKFTWRNNHKFLMDYSHTSIADKIAQPFAGFESQVNALLSQGHIIVEVTEEEVVQAHSFVNDSLHISSEPSAAIAFAGLSKMHFSSNETVVIVNTGNGLKYNSGVGKEKVVAEF